MVFTSYTYLAFLVVVVVSNYLVPGKLQNATLLLASFVFYYIAMPSFLWLLFSTGIVCYAAAMVLERIEKPTVRRALLLASVLLLLTPLLVFKYLGFFAGIVAPNSALAQGAIRLLLPLGISFYTFGALGYLMDVHGGSVKAEKNPVTCLLFLCFFPQLLSGPIGRAKKLLPQYSVHRPFAAENVRAGALRFLTGVFKKAVIADNLGMIVNEYYAVPAEYNTALVSGLVVALYALQIYFDFAGYSDMAIASGRMLGLELPENFDTPYFAVNFSGFWKRWHMSLTTWLTDYIFTPLVWSRWWNKLFFGKRWQEHGVHFAANIVIVFFISGLWHGAAYTFVVWGLLQGLFRLGEELIHKIKPLKKRHKDKLHVHVCKSVVVFILFALSLVFFRSSSLGEAMEVLRGTIHVADFSVMLQQADALVYRILSDKSLPEWFTVLMLGMSILVAMFFEFRQFSLPAKQKDRANPLLMLSEPIRWILGVFVFLAIITIGVFGVSNFIYFQF